MPVPNRLLKSELKQAEKPRKLLKSKEAQYFRCVFILSMILFLSV